LGNHIGFGQDNGTQGVEDKIKQEAKNWFKPEFLARLDKIVFFNNLDEASLKKIITVELSDLNQRLNKARNISLKYSTDLIGWIINVNKTLMYF
jgi:ATP-dependent Clp protease ATP-binding subunit ClpA